MEGGADPIRQTLLLLSLSLWCAVPPSPMPSLSPSPLARLSVCLCLIWARAMKTRIVLRHLRERERRAQHTLSGSAGTFSSRPWLEYNYKPFRLLTSGVGLLGAIFQL